jgi:riboflavin synthase
MKISFITSAESKVNILPGLVESLSKEIVDLEAEQAFVPSMLDIPLKALEMASTSELIFVFVLYPEKGPEVETLLEKLVDVELQTNTKIIKAVEQSAIEELVDEQELEAEKQTLVERWSKFIVDYLFNPDAFKPRY